ncbi:DUF6461 domain-containing protein [Streptomyces alboflavus]|uniref:DUF6461 domain-containing protein n=1 Tax=Streptomyces alboflavus TaxID=67267 RepID=UPI000F657942|nr:DUF6461 domain-containing protein [Streptomyces alboflavus]
MNQGPAAKGLSWIPDDYSVGFTLTLAENLSPHELLRGVGAEEHHILPLPRSAASELLLRGEEDHISDLDFLDWEDEEAVTRLTNAGFLPAPPDAIVRAGSVAGWAYALEEYSCHTEAHVTALSRRGRALCVHSSAKGSSHVDYALRGEPVTTFEPGLPHLTNGTPAEVALGFVHDGDEAGDVAFLRFLEDEFGLRIPWEETEAELPSAAFR